MTNTLVEVSQRVSFSGVHSLRRDVSAKEADASRRMHGHDYQATACVRGPIRKNGMVMDQAHLRREIEDAVEPFTGVVLDDIPGLGAATTENMAVRLWHVLAPRLPNLLWVSIGREAHGDLATYRGPQAG